MILHPCRPAAALVAGAVCLVLTAACASDDRPGEGPGEAEAGAVAGHAQDDGRGVLLDPDHPAWSEPAPDTFRVQLQTTRGDFVIKGVRAWAPLGADRFYNLVLHGYYDDARFHRTVPDFIVQWGLAGEPDVTAAWLHQALPDDPVVESNTRGRVAFAFTEPGTRTTQVFNSLVNLDRLDEGGFAPFGEVVEGMDVVDALHSGYGESSGGGMRAGAQDSVIAGGNDYLDRNFPHLDRLIRATAVPWGTSDPDTGGASS